MFQGLILDVSQSDTIIEAAWNNVSVFYYAHVFSCDCAFAKEKVLEPIIKVWHSPLFNNPRIEWTINIDFRFPLILHTQIVNVVPDSFVLL